MYPGQSDLPQEVPRPGGGKHAGELAAAVSADLMTVSSPYLLSAFRYITTTASELSSLSVSFLRGKKKMEP